MEDKIPDHSTLSKNRHGRFSRSNLFRELFYTSIGQAHSYGLVRGRHVTVDATQKTRRAYSDTILMDNGSRIILRKDRLPAR